MQTELFFLETLEPPKNQLASVLKMLIENTAISERETVFNGFRARISNLKLKYGLNIHHAEIPFENQFKHKSYYRKHFLYEWEKPAAAEVYKKINR